MKKRHTQCHHLRSAAVSTVHRVLYFTLVTAIFYCTVINRGNLSNIQTSERILHALSSQTQREDNDRCHGESSIPVRPTFNDLKFVRLIGGGTVNWVFEARLDGRTVAAKIASDKFIFYSDIEIDVISILKAHPSISNIPEVQLNIRSMPNPFSNQTFLQNDLGLSDKDAELLASPRRVSVQTMEFLTNKRKPATLQELRIYLQSLLETLDFVHSRNIIHCDLHAGNIHFDGHKVSLFDWNGAFVFEANKVRIHQPHAPIHLFPPEAQNNKSAVHATVSAFDIYTVGLLIKRYCRSSVISSNSNNTHTDAVLMGLAEDLADRAKTPDPYQRPNASQLLQHSFFITEAKE
jgi:serine/threonine protein kinase